MKILVIVPAYNEEASIKYVIDNIQKSFTESQIIIINDSSTDRTSIIAKQKNVIVIDLINNLGIGGAVQTGFQYALKNGYDIAVQIDGDGQHNPEFLNQLIAPIINSESDIVIGSRFLDNKSSGFKSSLSRQFGIKILRKIISFLIKQKITDPTSGFRAVNRKVIELFANSYPDDYPEPESLISLYQSNFKIKEIPVIMNKRYGGKSSIKIFDSIYYMIKVILAVLIKSIRK